MTRRKMVMQNRHFNRLVDESVLLGAKTISIFGYGEPLTDKGVINKVAYCTSRGLDTFITTNASLLNTEIATLLLKAGLKKIRFSVHGTYKNYEAIHRNLKFKDTLRNIQNFLAKNTVKYHNQCKVAVSVIPMSGESVAEIRKFWGDMVDELEIWKPHNWTDGRDYRESTPERKKTCGRPHKGPVQINADGNMMVCCYDFDAKMIVGNTYKNSIAEILRGDDFRLIRKCHSHGRLDGLPCETCDQLNIGDNPLLYSSIDPDCKEGKTSSTKFSLE